MLAQLYEISEHQRYLIRELVERLALQGEEG